MSQKNSSWFFYTGRIGLGVLVCLELLFCGVNAPVFYLLILGVAWPVIISLRLHLLSEQGVVLIPRELTGWITYVQGVPVQKIRQSLTNPCFFSHERASLFFANALTARLIVQLIALLMMLMQAAALHLRTGLYPCLLLVMVWMLYGMVRTGHSLLSVLLRSWVVEQLIAPSKSEWYRGYTVWRNRREAALDRVLALQ